MPVFKIRHDVMRPCVQPDQSVVQGLSCLLVPCDGCLSLIRDADSSDFRCTVLVDQLRTIPLNHLVVAIEDVRVDFHGVMFAPAGMLGDLLVLARRTIQNIQILVDQ